MLRVGLTGGIASGKTTAANLFHERGAPIIDTDKIAHQLVIPDKPAYHAIIKHFGQALLQNDKTINRALLRKKIFANADEKLWLEQLLHPLIRKEVNNQLEIVKFPYCIIVIPLLIENYPYPGIDRILVVDTPESAQIQRATTRDNMSISLAKDIIEKQVNRHERLKYADDVIFNDQDLKHLKKQVDILHDKYRVQP